MQTVKDIMTSKVFTVRMNDTLEEIEELMKEKGIRHLFVTENDQLVGVVSAADIKRRKSFWAGTDFSTNREEYTLSLKAHQMMTRKIIKISPSTSLVEALDYIIDNSIHCLPVTEGESNLCGVVTDTDLLRAFRTHLEWQQVKK
ncbi:MAG: CBS domain-containing protein [Lentisphaeraceae bacterium]|nr:CBS domain-containing protein [Lentisphaeraceae bacterium]